jgi:recombination protein RecA
VAKKDKTHRAIPAIATDKLAAATAAVGELEQKFGKGAIARQGAVVRVKHPCIPTGIYQVDHHVIGPGGVPRGRIVEVFGPESGGKTTLTLQIIAEAQQLGDLAAFIDAEHALDLVYAEALGVDVDNLYIAQPNSGEEALEIAETLVRSGAFGVVVVDSVAAMVPQAELDGDMGDSHMGLQARLMSQGCRKLVGAVSKTNTCLIFINQIREKIGVMFGCFSYNTRVVLEDGSTEKIGKIVNQRLNRNVLSVDVETGKVSSKPIVDWHDNGKAESFLRIETTNGLGRSGRSSMAVTPNHVILTPSGEIPAGDLGVGDIVYGLGRLTFSEYQFKTAIGSVLGDGSLRPTGKHGVTLRVRHGRKQKEYAQYKALIYGNMLVDAGSASNGSWGFATAASSDLLDLYNQCYDGKRRVLGAGLTANLSPEAIAIWYMDDGTFGGSYEKWGKGKCSISAKSYSTEELELLSFYIGETGLPKPTVSKQKQLCWYGEESYAFQKALAPFIHPSMEYKIHPSLRGQFKGLPEERDLYIEPCKTLISTTVTKVETAKPTRSMQKFDLSVADNQTYFVDGIAVHNSPETTTGGKALRFYASVRLDVRRTGTNKDGEEAVSNKTRIRGAKNKVGKPFREAEIDLEFGKGFNKVGSVLDAGIENGAITKSGASYSLGEEKLGYGRDKTITALEEDEALFDTVYTAVVAADTAEVEA